MSGETGFYRGTIENQGGELGYLRSIKEILVEGPKGGKKELRQLTRGKGTRNRRDAATCQALARVGGRAAG